jgi:hypothetical protein
MKSVALNDRIGQSQVVLHLKPRRRLVALSGGDLVSPVRGRACLIQRQR